MSEKHVTSRPGIGYIVSLCGVMSGLALALMFIMGMVPSFEYISPAVGGVLILTVRKQLGVKYGLVCYLCVALLSLLLVPNYEASMMFLFLLGYYPIIREYCLKIKLKILRIIVKLLLYAAAATTAYTVLIHLLGLSYLLSDVSDFGKYGSLVFLGLGAIAFLLYDYFLGLFNIVYDKLIKPKIQSRLK